MEVPMSCQTPKTASLNTLPGELAKNHPSIVHGPNKSQKQGTARQQETQEINKVQKDHNN